MKYLPVPGKRSEWVTIGTRPAVTPVTTVCVAYLSTHPTDRCDKAVKNRITSVLPASSAKPCHIQAHLPQTQTWSLTKLYHAEISTLLYGLKHISC